MFKKRSHNDQSNFWISYADLMAGLLFVFILLIGAIVSKSMILREDLSAKQLKLGETEVALMEKMDKLDATKKVLRNLKARLNQKERILSDINASLVESKMRLIRQQEVISSKKERIALQESLIQKKEKLVQKQKRVLGEKEQVVHQQKQEIQKKTIIVKKQKEVIVKKEKIIEVKKKIITEQEEKIRLQAEEVRKLHTLLTSLEADIRERKISQEAADSKIVRLGQRLTNTSRQLTQTQQNLQQTNEILKTEKMLGETKGQRIGQLEALITLTKDSLKLKESELERLNQLLLARNSKVDRLNGKVVLLQNMLQESNTTLQQKQKKLQEYVGRVIVLSNNLTDKEDELKLKDEKLATLLTAIDRKKTKYDALVSKLQHQRAKIKSLTGIKLKVIAALKETLGNKIHIDRQSGALKLASNILFDKGSSALKEGAKEELKRNFEEYIGALVSNEAIRPHLDRIVIEGHTDSDGTYLYNLKLSQERALAVMNYLLTLPIAQKYHLKKYLLASGRGYLDSIKKGGIEDKEASRRIEIKFQLKNQDAMHEIERILDEPR